MAIDRARILRRAVGDARLSDLDRQRLEDRINRSVARREARARLVRSPSFPADLPVSQRRAEIAAALSRSQVLVLCGETGSGKSTQIPKICLELGRGVGAMIGHTQPRRIAARGVADRIAEELSSAGMARTIVGHKVRFGDHTGPDTLIKLMTDGILLAETQTDPLLLAYDTIIIDEAHERSLNIDFLLGYVKRLLPRRPDLKVIITSATIDPERFSVHFDGAPILSVSGRTFPVEIRYRPFDAADEDEREESMEQLCVNAVCELLEECRTDPSGGGDILVFLPGEREIRETAELLREALGGDPGVELLPLFARLTGAEQFRVFRPPARARYRVVLSTNIAETSVTVPRIRYVVDTGLARISRYSVRTRVIRLPVEAISRASADQRAGRCGRVGPGICVRLYAADDLDARSQYTEPEIVRTNLASVILRMKALRLGDPRSFPFVERPEERLIKDGFETLRELAAVDDRGELTALGLDMARLPIDPRLSRMVLAARDHGCLSEVLVVAAALSVQDPRERPMESPESADIAHARFRDERSDFVSILRLWRFYRQQKNSLSGSRLRRLCRDDHLSFVRLREWEDVHRQLTEMVRDAGAGEPDAERQAEYEPLHRALLTGLLSSVGRRMDAFEYSGVRGIRFNIHPGSGLFKPKPRWVMAAELVRTTRLYARCVAEVSPAWIERAGEHVVERDYRDPRWDDRGQQVMAMERVTLFGLELASGRPVPYGPVNPTHARELFIREGLATGALRTTARFARHNADLLEKLRALQHKGRRNDLLRDTGAEFDFFDARVASGVWSGSGFERWRRAAEKEDPQLLFMTEADLLAQEAVGLGAEWYPDQLEVEGRTFSLTYRHAPGEIDDGVTLTVPIEAINRIRAERADWLVPGMLEEKFLALIRSLPKHLRTSFIPAPVFAARATEAAAGTSRPVLEVLAETLGRLGGVSVRADDFKPQDLPPHLKMNYRVVDTTGAVLGQGRELALLRRSLAGLVARLFESMPRGPFNYGPITRWDFDTMPEKIEVEHGSTHLFGFPGLAERAGAVFVRVFSNIDEARASHARGLLRLMLLESEYDTATALRRAEDIDRLTILYAPFGGRAELRAMLLERAAAEAFLGSDAEQAVGIELAAWKIRSRSEFDERLAAGYAHLDERLRSAANTVLAVLIAAGEATRTLDRVSRIEPFQPVVVDARAQIGSLLTARFLADTPSVWLAQVPRYLRAIRYRVEKLEESRPPSVGAAFARDAENTRRVARWWAQYEAASAALERSRDEESAPPLDRRALLHLRWMIEEYRVSLFSQAMGTMMRVSDQRLEEQWARVRGASPEQ